MGKTECLQPTSHQRCLAVNLCQWARVEYADWPGLCRKELAEVPTDTTDTGEPSLFVKALTPPCITLILYLSF